MRSPPRTTPPGSLFSARFERAPFLSYVSVGPLYVEWGDGLIVHIGRLIFSCRMRLRWRR